MQRLVVYLSCLLLFLLTSACEQAQQSVSNTEPAAGAAAEQVAIDESRYIRAGNLLQRIESGDRHFVFDVRAKASFADSHIAGALSMPYGKVEQSDLAAIDGLELDTPIVTYCGCPHHLAGLGADQLIGWGYRNVRVLYEGFWFWRDANYPVAGAQAQAPTELLFSGLLQAGDNPLVDIDVFIRNARNGQLEAAKTDLNGRFETGFHILDYRPDDRFEIRVGRVDAPPLRVIGAASKRANEYRI